MSQNDKMKDSLCSPPHHAATKETLQIRPDKK